MSKVIDQIKEFQRKLPANMHAAVPEHNPEMLLIGCVDARLNPADDIGIPYGKALIKRNIAALVPPKAGDGTGVGAVLAFAIEKMGVKDVVVMGHTHCGGIAACLDGVEDPEIDAYLAPLQGRRKAVEEEGGSTEVQARSMEREAVRQSLANLKTYPAVTNALEAGAIELHGWVIDTATGKLSVLDHETGKFGEMA